MSTAENYITNSIYRSSNKQLVIGFDNITYDGQMNCLFDNNIKESSDELTISLNEIIDEDTNMPAVINEIDGVSFSIENIYISPINGEFLLNLYSKNFSKIKIIYGGNNFYCNTFYFNVIYLYLLENLDNLSLNLEQNCYYINPEDTNDIFIQNDNDLYLQLNEYNLINNEGIQINIRIFINCLSSNYSSLNNHLLIVKGEIPSKIMDYLPLGSKKFKVYVNSDRENIREEIIKSINNRSNIPINNVTPIPNENDSFIDFRGILLTEEQKQNDYWESFYVNKIIRFEDQVFNFTFKGYRGNQLIPSTEEVIKIKDVEIKNIGYYTVLIITFEKGTPGFLGKTQRVKLPGLTELQETVVIYLDEEMSAKVNNEATLIKFVVEDMEAIVPETNKDSVNLNLNFYTNRTPEGPTYVAVYHLNQYGTYSASALSIELLDQEITKLNIIYGTVNKNNDKKLIVPLDVDVDNVWSEDKLNLKEIVTSGIGLTINEIKTTNCLATNAKLNIVVQGTIPIDWYGWLPLNEVYVGNDKKVIVNPTGPGDYPTLTKIVSVNALPSNYIGIDTSTPSELDLSGIDLETGEPLENN